MRKASFFFRSRVENATLQLFLSTPHPIHTLPINQLMKVTPPPLINYFLKTHTKTFLLQPCRLLTLIFDQIKLIKTESSQA